MIDLCVRCGVVVCLGSASHSPLSHFMSRWGQTQPSYLPQTCLNITLRIGFRCDVGQSHLYYLVLFWFTNSTVSLPQQGWKPEMILATFPRLVENLLALRASQWIWETRPLLLSTRNSQGYSKKTNLLVCIVVYLLSLCLENWLNDFLILSLSNRKHRNPCVLLWACTTASF